MNNFQLEVVSSGKSHFELAMKLAGRDGAMKATHYGVQGKKRLALFICSPFDCDWEVRELPSPMDVLDFTEFAWSWLHSGDCDYGNPPACSEEPHKGFRVSVGSGGYVDHMWQAFVAVEPKWELQGTVTS